MFWNKGKIKRNPGTAGEGENAGIEKAGIDAAAVKIAGFIMRVQVRFANYMNRRTKRISPVMWRVIIFVFVIGGGTVSFYFILRAFTKEQSGMNSRNKKMQFIVRPPRNDSLVILEKIYEQHKAGNGK